MFLSLPLNTRIRVDGAASVKLGEFLAANNFSMADTQAIVADLDAKGIRAIPRADGVSTVTLLTYIPPVEAPAGQIASHDGYVWKFARQDMVDVADIQDRFADDAEALLRERGSLETVEVRDFIRLGWSDMQVKLHGAEAISTAKHRLKIAA